MSAVRSYLLNGFNRGVPSLFVDLRPLYSDEEKRVIVEEIVEGFREEIEKGGSIPGMSIQNMEFLC